MQSVSQSVDRLSVCVVKKFVLHVLEKTFHQDTYGLHVSLLLTMQSLSWSIQCLHVHTIPLLSFFACESTSASAYAHVHVHVHVCVQVCVLAQVRLRARVRVRVRM